MTSGYNWSSWTGVVSPAGHSQYLPHFVESLRECEALKNSSVLTAQLLSLINI